MPFLFVGLLFLTFSYSMPLESGQAFEIIPDFVGYEILGKHAGW